MELTSFLKTFLFNEWMWSKAHLLTWHSYQVSLKVQWHWGRMKRSGWQRAVVLTYALKRTTTSLPESGSAGASATGPASQCDPVQGTSMQSGENLSSPRQRSPELQSVILLGAFSVESKQLFSGTSPKHQRNSTGGFFCCELISFSFSECGIFHWRNGTLWMWWVMTLEVLLLIPKETLNNILLCIHPEMM